LSDIINHEHINTKYLPGIVLPDNLKAIPDLVEATKDSTLLVFVLPHQFLKKTCETIKGHIAPNARAISLIKGLEIGDNGPVLMSDVIKGYLGVDVSVLMGANIANEVAKEIFSEATIGFRIKENALIFQQLFNTKYFRVAIIDDVPGVEICGALKNIVALAAGFVDGLGMGGNTKSAVIRLGLWEMKRFAKLFYQGIKDDTFWESCGIADVLVTCLEGRNRRCAEAFAKTGKPFLQLEEELLNGQKLQGTLTANEVHQILVKKGLINEFPLFSIVYEIVFNRHPVKELMDSFSTDHYFAHHPKL